MHARIVTTKERKYGDLVRREGSPVPGVELFDPVDGNLHISIIQNTNFETKYNFQVVKSILHHCFCVRDML